MAEAEDYTMKRRIRIGYIGQNRSWEQLLGQIGVAWERLNPGKSISIASYSSVIVDRKLSRSEQTHVDEYLKNNGALLDATGTFCSGSLRKTTLTAIYPESEDPLFGHIDVIPVYGSAYRISSSGLLDGTVWLDPSPKRHLAFCGLPVDRLWHDYKTIHKSFGNTSGAATAERASALQSHPYFEVILTLLKTLHDQSGLPFIHTWWHPDSKKHAATFRIDSDYGNLESITTLSKSAQRSNIPLTWFLHVSHHAGYLPQLIESIPETDEIALHCYRHYEYQTEEQYRSDILEGLKLLQKNGVYPKGYAAPYGSWTEAIASALQQFSFEYTSEFGYDYDSLPSVSKKSSILQLPIHPVSIGSFRRFRSEMSDVRHYFNQTIKLKHLTHQPLHLYHHPNDGEPDQFTELLTLLEPGDYQWMTYTDWSNWWRQRTAAAFNAYFDTDTVQLGITGSGSHQFPMAIHLQNKFHISFISDTTLHLGELPFRPYINPELKSIIEKRKSETAISWFRQTKDQWLTHIWRNRA
jgi:hypothetical protein